MCVCVLRCVSPVDVGGAPSRSFILLFIHSFIHSFLSGFTPSPLFSRSFPLGITFRREVGKDGMAV